jgi:hypothetical protein
MLSTTDATRCLLRKLYHGAYSSAYPERSYTKLYNEVMITEISYNKMFPKMSFVPNFVSHCTENRPTVQLLEESKQKTKAKILQLQANVCLSVRPGS